MRRKHTLQITLPGGQVQRYAVSTSRVTIGRATDNKITLPDPKVSGHHAHLQTSGSSVQIVDLQSSNGTYVNGQRIPAHVPSTVSPGDTVQLGDTTVQLQLAQPDRGPHPSASAERPPLRMQGHELVLQASVSGRTDEIAITKAELTFGRADDNDVILDHPQVSGHHARLRVGGNRLEIMDLGSLNGTRLNGQPLANREPSPLRVGDRIQIASFLLAVRVATSGAPAPAPLTSRVRLSSSAHPGLVVHATGEQKRYLLGESSVTLGRSPDSSIVVSSPVVSGHHARIHRSNGSFWIEDLGSRNGLLFQGEHVARKALADGDVLHIGRDVALEFREHIGFQPVAARLAPLPSQTLQLNTDTITIGRAQDNSMVLDHPQVSRYHAVIERLGMRQRVTDLKSSNGVFVNGSRIEKEAWLKEGDEIRIGPYRLNVGENLLQRMAEEGLRIDALHLQKWVTKSLNLLEDISLSIHPQEFVALVGLSGAGKSTLMDALNGFRPATHGAVFVNNVNLYQQFDLFRNDMGYVPQQDIVHTELTIYTALDYAAQLRMPADTTPDERHQRILEVLEELDLSERRDVPIHKLSGGQLKRVSIGVELLTKPRLFFLDEPTSGLDPGTEYNMMRLLRKLADQGRTILLITHATKNVMMCDKVIILVRGGHLAYYGPPEEALSYFDQFRTDREQRTKDIEFDDIYTILEDETRGNSEDWAQRYKRSPQYVSNVVQRLQERAGPTPAAKSPTGVTAASMRRQTSSKGISALRQFFVLSKRNLSILTQDKATLALMLAVSPLIGLTDFMWGGTLFDPVEGDPGKIITMLFMGALISILVGALGSVREIVKEVDIYKRERAVNLRIVPYIMSKVWIGFVLALYQALVFLISRSLMAGLGPGRLGAAGWVALYVTLFVGALSGYLMGLAISAAAPNQNVALLLVTVVLVPQFLFAGGLMPLDLISGGEMVSYIVSTRWAFEAAVNITGFGEPLVEDPCWDSLEKYGENGEMGWNDYLSLTGEEKEAAGCICMGPRLFEGPCSHFPGILNEDYYTEEAQSALAREGPQRPEQPTPYPTFTPYPTLTPLPTPENPADFEGYMDDMQAQGDEYQDLREAQGDEYQDLREAQGDEYEVAAEGYADDRTEWQQDREQAVASAEGMLRSMYEGYAQAFKGNYTSRWLKMGVIMLGMLGLIVVFQKRKDAV